MGSYDCRRGSPLCVLAEAAYYDAIKEAKPTGPDDGSEWDAYQAVNEYFEKLNA
jgi:hypothetical protein